MPAVRSRSRGWALQTLYAWESRGESIPLRAFLAQFLTERRVSGRAQEWIIVLVGQVADHRDTIDSRLQDCLHNWRLERLSVIDRNILRLGAAELLFLPEVPPRVAIQEAILLAEKYGTEQSPRFVNGVLDALMRAGGTPGEGT